MEINDPIHESIRVQTIIKKETLLNPTAQRAWKYLGDTPTSTQSSRPIVNRDSERDPVDVLSTMHQFFFSIKQPRAGHRTMKKLRDLLCLAASILFVLAPPAVAKTSLVPSENEMPFLAPLHLNTPDGDQMQIYSVDGGLIALFFLQGLAEPLKGSLLPIENGPVQQVHLRPVDPLHQLFPVWRGAAVKAPAQAAHATVDLSSLGEGSVTLHFGNRLRQFNRAARMRFFTIGLPREKGGFRTRAAFPVLESETFADLPLTIDLANFLTTRTAELAEQHKIHLRDPSRTVEHFVVVYPIEINNRAVSFLAVERTYFQGAHGDYDVASFSYLREADSWRRIIWEDEIWENPRWREIFAEKRRALAEALESVAGEPQQGGWVAVPVAGQILVKFRTYMIGPYAVTMPEMFIPINTR